MQINRELAHQAIDKLLSTTDERLRLIGGGIIRLLEAVTAIEERQTRIQTEIARLGSESGEVSSDYHRSMRVRIKKELGNCEYAHHRIVKDVNELLLEIFSSQFDEPIDIACK